MVDVIIKDKVRHSNQMSTIAKVAPERKSLPSRGLKSSPQIWMDEKRQRDASLWNEDTSNLWIFENKLYDLTQFASNHPGGSSWIQLTRGQDITEHFIIHHLNQAKARALLDKFYIRDAQNHVSRYTFEQDGLYRTVKREVLSRMTPEQIQNQTTSIKSAKIILSLFLFSLIATCYLINDGYAAYVTAGISSILLVGMTGIGHNFIHHKNGPYKYFFIITGFTHNQWQIMHCLSHHLYPNLQLDYEAAALEPFAYFLRISPPNQPYTEIIIVLLFIFIQPLNFILKLLIVPLLKRKIPELWYAVPFSVFCLFYLASGDAWLALKLHIFMYGLFGFIISRVLFCGHRLQEIWTEGAEKIQDFGEHTMHSTSDTDLGLKGIFSYILVAGFNFHTPHHFFPTADHHALERILKIIEEVCQKRSVKHSVHNRWTCMKSISRGIIKRIPYVKDRL